MNTGSRSPGLEGHGENPLIISTVCMKEPQAVLQAGGTRLATSCLQSVTWNSLPGLSSGNWGLFGPVSSQWFFFPLYLDYEGLGFERADGPLRVEGTLGIAQEVWLQHIATASILAEEPITQVHLQPGCLHVHSH